MNLSCPHLYPHCQNSAWHLLSIYWINEERMHGKQQMKRREKMRGFQVEYLILMKIFSFSYTPCKCLASTTCHWVLVIPSEGDIEPASQIAHWLGCYGSWARWRGGPLGEDWLPLQHQRRCASLTGGWELPGGERVQILHSQEREKRWQVMQVGELCRYFGMRSLITEPLS